MVSEQSHDPTYETFNAKLLAIMASIVSNNGNVFLNLRKKLGNYAKDLGLDKDFSKVIARTDSQMRGLLEFLLHASIISDNSELL